MLACCKQSVVETTIHCVLWFSFILLLRSLNVYYKVNIYTHDCIREEKDNLRTECDARHPISNVTLSLQYAQNFELH